MLKSTHKKALKYVIYSTKYMSTNNPFSRH